MGVLAYHWFGWLVRAAVLTVLRGPLTMTLAIYTERAAVIASPVVAGWLVGSVEHFDASTPTVLEGREQCAYRSVHWYTGLDNWKRQASWQVYLSWLRQPKAHTVHD